MDSEKTSHSVNIICSDTVRYSFVSHLSGALRRQDISVSVFADTDGRELETCSAPDDQNEGARVSVVVFSETYASSIPWFVKLLERHKNNGYVIVPVFYGVDPSVVNRNHECLRTLPRAGNSTGHHSSDSELVEEIVRDVYGKLFPTERIGTYSRLLEIENLLCEQPWDIRSLGIWGMPGIGKTTLAKSVFDQVSTDYDASCFIENFDEALYKAGPHRLLEEKVLKTVIEKFGVSSCYITRLSLLRDKLCDTRILLVLDDVRNPLVAESFLGRLDWFGPGSLIIITSRYKQVFALCQVNQIYKVRGLSEQEALYLFSQSAFEKDMPEKNDTELSMKVIDYANGNPLALRIYGRELKGKKSEMEAAFLDLKQCPPPKIQDGIRSVYGALGDNEKHIFLDIACFFRGENVDYAVQLLKGCGYFPRVGIDVLVDKCLVTISENTLQMNDLIQDIFREIFIEERIQMKKCTTLWQASIIRYLLEDDELEGDDEPKETPKCVMVAEDIKGISLDTSNLVFVVNPDAFKNMVSLRFLKIYSSHSANVPGLEFPKGLNSLPRELRLLHWENYPFETLPQGFDLRELVELNMPYSQLKKLRARTKNLERLKRIRLCHSRQLVKFSIHGHAQNVELIDVQGCVRLDSFPAMTKLQHLRVLNLSGCSNIRTIPGLPPNIEELSLQGTSIEELPKSIVAGCSQPNGKELMNHMKYFPGFEHIDLESVTNLVKVSTYNQGFGKLVRLNMKDCFHLRSLLDMSNLESLQTLDLSGCFSLEEIKGFPRNMKELYLAGTRIRELPEFPPSLEFLNAHDCYVLKSVRFEFEQLPRHYTFSNCFSLTSETTVEFLEKGLTKVIRLDREKNQEHIKAPAFNICFPADTCPCTSVHWRAGSFVMVELSPSTRQALLGFAMLVRVSFQDDCHNTEGLGIRCICTWGTKNGHFGRIERVFKCWAPTEAPRVEKDHIFVFYDSEMHPCAGEKKYSSTSDDEIKFEFHTVSGENKLLGANCMVIECGVQVITAPTGDKLVSEIIGESECRGIIEEDTPPLARKPEAKSTSVIEEDTTLFPREPEAQSISVIEEVTPFPREPEAKSLSVIEEVTPPFLREPEATSRSLSSSEPHKRYSMYSKPRSKRIAFWKWLDCFPRVTSMPHKNLKTRRSHSRDIDEAIEASRWSKEEGKINQVDAKEQIKPSNDDVEEDVKSPPSTCNGCNSAIEDGISVNALGAVWHPECFCCLHCHRPIAMHEIPGLKRMYHKPCYKELRLSNCYVCKEKIPSTEEGRKYYAHPFWGEKYCPSHEVDGTHKCFSCERLEPRGTNYVLLADGRWLCPECMESAVMDTYECHSLHIEIREFFEGLNLKVEKEFPVLLVETQALNKAVDEEKSDYHHAAVTRGVCLSEEQIVSIVLRITLMGPSKQQINIVRETQKVCGCEVTAILIMYGLPRLLTGYILVHEMMHAWLRLNDVRNLTNHGEAIFGLIAGCTNINFVLEEGLCQVSAFMWLESQKGATLDVTLDASSSSNFSAATTSKKGDQSDFEKKFLEFCKEQIKNDDGPVFGPGFKKVMKMMDSNNNNLMKTLKDIVRAAKF